MTVSLDRERRPHRRARLDVSPPPDAIGGSVVIVALWLDLVLDISERLLIGAGEAGAARPARGLSPTDHPEAERVGRELTSS
jgi:hypothetical protein